ncbi:hypothetical protein HRTV-25_gp19 [Halorubrum tailed virus 25]|uniref:Uncharacterized protein n=1 Tax=Halorubrum tailed virus 25 TaxID=2878006 RepID=A0AAE9BXJ9_9CAUD|nr:hypothetical protein M1M37_gp019 [Halorubrum tailed virus 25]UBF22600.1 hypothetical protein HRTV-25_gp19 [Halorubrum tailed virus 25]
MATFRVDVDGKKVARRIRDRIEDGVDSAADEINDEMRQVAKGKIRDENAVFTRELLHGFTDAKVTFGKSTVASLRNLSDHAPYQERGVSGIYKKRDTPYSYKNKKPPLDALIPWVIQNLHGSFWPDDLGDPPDGYGDSVASAPSSSSRTAGSGGVDVVNTENGVPLDENRMYAGETGFVSQSINDPFDVSELFPYQNVVLYDVDFKRYLRGTVTGFPSADDSNVKIDVDRVGGGTFKVFANNEGNFRIAGYEDFEQASESSLKARLKGYFDTEIRGNQGQYLGGSRGLTDPDPSRMDWVRDKWANRIWDSYKDKWYVKEQFRLLDAVLDYKSSAVGNKLGGIGRLNGSRKYVGVFLSQQNLQAKKISEAKYLDTLIHESEHALSAVADFDHPGDNAFGPDILRYAEFDRDGIELTGRVQDDGGKPINLPTDAKQQLFHDGDGNPIGGYDWMGEAYDAAQSGQSGIESYSPSFAAGSDEEVRLLHEAANYAYWLQTVAVTEGRGGGSVDDKDPLFVEWSYSITNAEETLATFHKVMSSEFDFDEDRIRMIALLYPWLIEAWLKVHNPSNDVKDLLQELGFNV